MIIEIRPQQFKWVGQSIKYHKPYSREQELLKEVYSRWSNAHHVLSFCTEIDIETIQQLEDFIKHIKKWKK